MSPLPIIEKITSGNSSFKYSKSGGPSFLFFFYLAFIVLFFIFLGIRLFHLTIVKGDYYRRLADENRIQRVIIEPKRGDIIDRDGEIIATTIMGDTEKDEDRILSKRIYNSGEIASHIIGYRQIGDKSELENDNCKIKLKLGDKVGKKGIEKLYECELRGRNGEKLIELDARGNYLKTLTVLPPEAGKTIQLALDLDLQKIAYEQLKDKKGAIIAIKPKTGEILTIVSSPSFNPQSFEDNNQEAITGLLGDDNDPIFNRVTEGTYPIGSVIKPFIAAGALEDKKIDENTKIEDTGFIKAGPITFGNWYFLEYGKTEGEVDVIKALKRSNDIFFYKVGELLSAPRIKYWLNVFGFGGKTNLEINHEEGIVPSPFWKEETLKERWFLGDTYNFSIGQGYMLVTPLQVVHATSVFANNGELCDLNLLKSNKSKCKSLGLSNKTIELIRTGMRDACATGGTGWPLFDFSVNSKSIQTGCKTGTAESVGKDKPHAWISVFAPYEDPEIVVTVLVENGGQGSDIAGPMAKEILKTYFSK
ncbi:MAG: penicillin-binding transpeptidase domain-containing protein [Patescibacteria group bacterium]